MSKATSPKLTAEQAEKILSVDMLNLARKVSAGRTLTAQERARVQEAAEAVELEPSHEAGTLPTFAPNQSALAECLGVTRQLVAYHCKRPGSPGRCADGRYPVAKWQAYLALFGRGSGSEDARGETAQLKARQILLQNKKLEYEISTLRKQYVSVTDVQRFAADLKTRIPKVVKRLHKLAPKLAGLSVADTEARLREAEAEMMEGLHNL